MAGVTTMLAQTPMLFELPWNIGSAGAWAALGAAVVLASARRGKQSDVRKHDAGAGERQLQSDVRKHDADTGERQLQSDVRKHDADAGERVHRLPARSRGRLCQHNVRKHDADTGERVHRPPPARLRGRLCSPSRLRSAIALAAGTLAFLAFASPIGVLADGQLFAAHMLQHILLLLVVPLGIVLALPPAGTAAALARPVLRPLAALLSMAPLAWLAGVGAMWAWHQPLACSAALASPAMAMVRDLSFLLAGTLFWWPIVGPVARHRVEPPLGLAYLVSACIACTVLGVAVTFAASTPCPVFVEVAAPLPVVERLRSMGFTPRIDQQTGGLFMWMLPCLIYLATSVSLLRRWYAAPVREQPAEGLP